MTYIKPTGRPNIPAVTDGLLADKTINRGTNDYSAYLRGRNPGSPSLKVAQQTKMDIREARKLTEAVKDLPKAWQGAVLKELHTRSESKDRFGSLALSENAAKELSGLAKQLGLDIKFAHGQQRPMHPVG